jgi:hypothetical protein
MLDHLIVSQHFMEPEGSIPNSQELSTCSYPEPDKSSQVLVFLVVSFPLAFPPIIYTHSSSSPFVLHDQPISSSSTSLFWLHLAKSTNQLLCNLLHSLVTSSFFDPNILLSILFSKILSLCSSLNVRDQVSHPCRTTSKIIILFILIFKFFDSRREDRRFWTEW